MLSMNQTPGNTPKPFKFEPEWVTSTICALTLILNLVVVFYPPFGDVLRLSLFEYWGGSYYKVISSLFWYPTVWHAIIGSIYFYQFASPVEKFLGVKKFLIFTISYLVLANIVGLLLLRFSYAPLMGLSTLYLSMGISLLPLRIIGMRHYRVLNVIFFLLINYLFIGDLPQVHQSVWYLQLFIGFFMGMVLRGFFIQRVPMNFLKIWGSLAGIVLVVSLFAPWHPYWKAIKAESVADKAENPYMDEMAKSREIEDRINYAHLLLASGKEGKDSIIIDKLSGIETHFYSEYLLAKLYLTSQDSTYRDYNKAMDHFQKALKKISIQERTQNYVASSELKAELFNDLAYLYCCSGDSTNSNLKKAFSYARKANELTGWKNPMIIDTFAACFTHEENWKSAEVYSKMAVEYGKKVLDEENMKPLHRNYNKIRNKQKIYIE